MNGPGPLPAPHQQPPAPDLGGKNAWRKRLEHGGRVHVDRRLPFIVLAHHGTEAFSLARRVAAISASSIVWPLQAGDVADVEAMAHADALLDLLQKDYPRFLVIALHDLPRDASLDEESPRLEPFRFELGASLDEATQAAATSLDGALQAISIDLREAKVADVPLPAASPGLQALLADHPGVSRIALGIPQIHRVPGGGDRGIYPLIYHELESATYDALLLAFATFIEHTTPDGDGDGEPGGRPHHRSLGRSRFLQAAAKADAALAKISGSFDFLLAVSPINSVEAYERFEADRRQKAPAFRYRPLAFSPDVLKRHLYRIDLRAVEDPVLEGLFREKQLELDQQLMMLQRRNTPAFRYASLLQYGGVEPELLAQAKLVLEKITEPSPRDDDASAGPEDVQHAADAVIARYREQTPAFDIAETCLRSDTGPGLMVSGPSLLISTATRMPAFRVDPLLQHEIGVHLLTYVNGSQQGLGIFGHGLADYEGIQEGLGVFAEFLVGGLSVARLRLLAARVLIVDAMLDGADFIQCHRLLNEAHDFSSRGAFNIVARIFRSGGFSKDAIYLRGFQQVLHRVAQGRSLDAFWYGKIAERHIPVVEELRLRGMLQPPAATPEFLQRPVAQATLARLRDGTPFLDLLRSPTP